MIPRRLYGFFPKRFLSSSSFFVLSKRVAIDRVFSSASTRIRSIVDSDSRSSSQQQQDDRSARPTVRLTIQQDVQQPKNANNLTTTPTIGILRESYNDWERRTPLCPEHVQQLSRQTKVLIQPSSQRCFSESEYEKAGAIVMEDLSDADVLLGVKRPADPAILLEDKAHVFFSHVIKGQETNMALLQTILDKRIQLMDYECIVSDDNRGGGAHRLVAFGRYAGLAGMIDTFYPLGRRLLSDYNVHTPFLQCPLASMQHDLEHAKSTIRQLGEQIAVHGLSTELTDPIVLGVTGGPHGRVYSGAMEIIKLLPHEMVRVQDLPSLFSQASGISNQDRYKVYTVTPSSEELYQRRSDGTFPSMDDWKNHPSDYDCNFATTVAPYIHALVNCIYWDPRYARLLTKQDAQWLHEKGHDRLKVISDISCDIHGSIEFLDRTCSIANPFFQYNPLTRQEVSADIGDKGITVMGTDILPAELPKESSQHFGDAVMKMLNVLFESRAKPEAAEDPGLNLQRYAPLLASRIMYCAPRFVE